MTTRSYESRYNAIASDIHVSTGDVITARKCLSISDYIPEDSKIFAVAYNAEAAKIATKNLIKMFGVNSTWSMGYKMTQDEIYEFKEWLMTVCEDKVNEWINEGKIK